MQKSTLPDIVRLGGGVILDTLIMTTIDFNMIVRLARIFWGSNHCIRQRPQIFCLYGDKLLQGKSSERRAIQNK